MHIESLFKIRGYHCDSYGHLNNARYLELFEEARWQMLDHGNIVKEMSAKNLLFYVVNINVTYRKPVNDGCTIAIFTGVNEIARKTITLRQEIWNQTKDSLLAEAQVKFVLFDSINQRAANIDSDVISLFEKYK